MSTPPERTIRTLERIIEWRGRPNRIRCNNDGLPVGLSSPTPQHGYRLYYTKTEIGLGHIVSTFKPRQKEGDYPRAQLPNLKEQWRWP